jgi:hypothetical protein
LGYIYGNLIVNVHTGNEKLIERALSILEEAAGVDRQAAAQALKAAGNHVAVALIMLKAGTDRRRAEKKLKAAKGNVRKAIASGQPRIALKTTSARAARRICRRSDLGSFSQVVDEGLDSFVSDLERK